MYIYTYIQIYNFVGPTVVMNSRAILSQTWRAAGTGSKQKADRVRQEDMGNMGRRVERGAKQMREADRQDRQGDRHIWGGRQTWGGRTCLRGMVCL